MTKFRKPVKKEENGIKGNGTMKATMRGINADDRKLVEAIRRGKSRDPMSNVTDDLIRSVVISPGFISAIESGAVKTHLEEAGSESAEEMMEVRKRLATELKTGDVGPLSAFQLDIIKSTMLGLQSLGDSIRKLRSTIFDK